MTTRKNRLQRYKKHAKQGKLDPNQNPNLQQSNEKPPGSASGENIPSGSVESTETRRIPIDGTLSLLAEALVKDVVGTLSDVEIFRGIETSLRMMGKSLAFMVYMDKETNQPCMAFNAHFSRCKCDGCKEFVAYIKETVATKFDEYGAILDRDSTTKSD